MRIIAIYLFASVAFETGGCLSRDYVLKQAIEVQFEGSDTPVLLPAGTHVRSTFRKGNYDFIEVQGGTTHLVGASTEP